MVLMFCGLSGVGKTTLAKKLSDYLTEKNIEVEIIDGDDVRQNLFKELGYSIEDRRSNMQRMAWIANILSKHDIVTIISAMNPDQATREEIKKNYKDVKEIYLTCSLETLYQRDTKGLYSRSKLPQGDKNKIDFLSGVNDVFDQPIHPDIIIDTDKIDINQCVINIYQEFFNHE